MKKKKSSPYIIIILSFIGLILIGTFLLLLPISTVDGYKLSVIDALFTATSAVCVTGLVSVPSIAGVYTTFGQVIVIMLVEIGGLGFVTIATFAFSFFGMKINISDRIVLKEALNQNTLKGLVKLVRITVIYTLIIQFIGIIVNMFVFTRDYNFFRSLGISTFHSIAAFNNAGFDILGNQSLIGYKNNFLLNINTSLLIILGGIGFIVINDVIRKKSWKKLSIHSKIVIKTSIILIVIGTVLLKFTEGNSISWLQAYFQSVSARTAGFATMDYTTLTISGFLVLSLLMYIGASPASTGGGIKTTTMYTALKYVQSFATGKKAVAYKRGISEKSIAKAFTLIVLSIIYIILIILFISSIEISKDIVQQNQSSYFVKIVFEVVSAFGTVGNSMAFTSSLHPLSKFLICLTMFIGRLGPITMVSVLNRKWNMESESDIKYIEEKIIIG